MSLIIGQFSDSYIPITDGVANVVKNYAYWLNKKHIKTYVITPTYPNYIDNEEIDVIRFSSIPVLLRPPYRFGIPFINVRITKKIMKIPFSLIHAHSPFSAGVLALYTAKKRKIPIIATFHTKYYDDFKSAVKSDFLAKIMIKIVVDFYNQVDEVWTVNKSTADVLREYGFRKKIEVVPNGSEFIPPSTKEVEEYRRRINEAYNLNPEEVVFLYIGQLIFHKNLEVLIHSLKYLRDFGINFKAFIVGIGKDETYLKNLVGNLNLNKNVIFTGKILDREFLKSFYARADLFLFPSLYDSSAVVIKEASSLGCPSLLIENSITSEGVVDNYNGFLSKNHPLLYAKRIKELISDKEKLRRVGEKAKETLYKHWKDIIDEVRERYKDAIERYKLKTF